MQRIVFLDRGTVDAHVRSPSFAHEWTDHRATAPEQVVARLEGAQIAVVNKVKLPAPAIAALPELRLVAVAATGVDNVDLEACRARDVAVCNVPDYAATSVAEHVIAGVLALRRNLFAYRAAMARGEWARSEVFCAHLFPIEDVAGSTMVIYGHGAIGAATAARARGVGMQVVLSERAGARRVRPGRVPFEQALERADVLSLHCPLTETNRGLLDAAALARMKPTSLVVNTARGALVDLDALHVALLDGAIGGAMIDVMPHEPPKDGHALLSSGLPNLIVTPHVAWASRDTQQRLADRVVDAIEAFVEGRLETDLAASHAPRG